MVKSTIILADTDERFLSPIEIKFLEELDDSVDIEVITDEEYFNEFFSTPKNADVLVVSEQLYEEKIKKHNIGSIFVLSEDIDEGCTEDLTINNIYKYTSPKEIYKQVMALSSIGSEAKKEKRTAVVLVYSASGGVGKSTLALSISTALSKSFNKVLYINAQRINTFQNRLNNDSTLPNSAVGEFTDISGNLFGRINHVIRNEGFDYLPPFSMALPSIGLDFSVYLSIIKSAKATKKYDVIIVDTDVTFDKEKTDLITIADKVFIVLSQSKASVFATNVLLKNISCNDSEKYYFICNNFDEKQMNALNTDVNINNIMVNEYVRHFESFDSLSLSELAKEADIQKISYLIA